jgi:hypothetical protein
MAQTEPEPIDLLEVAGGAAMARYAAPRGRGVRRPAADPAAHPSSPGLTPRGRPTSSSSHDDAAAATTSTLS